MHRSRKPSLRRRVDPPQRKPTRAERCLCPHLSPVLTQLLAAGYCVRRTSVNPREYRRRDFDYVGTGGGDVVQLVDVLLKTGPDYRELRKLCSWPKDLVIYGREDDGMREASLGRFLYCRRCIHTLWWPLPDGRLFP